MELLVKPEILTSYIYISYPVAQLCVNTLLATKVTPITDGILFGTLRVNVERVKRPGCRVDPLPDLTPKLKKE
jgi:hypothetical protein